MASGKNGKTEHRNVTHTTFSKMVRGVIQIPVEARWAKLDKQSIAPCFFRKHSNAGDCKQGGARLRLVTLREDSQICPYMGILGKALNYSMTNSANQVS